jgi:hypothetical protein
MLTLLQLGALEASLVRWLLEMGAISRAAAAQVCCFLYFWGPCAAVVDVQDLSCSTNSSTRAESTAKPAGGDCGRCPLPTTPPGLIYHVCLTATMHTKQLVCAGFLLCSCRGSKPCCLVPVTSPTSGMNFLIVAVSLLCPLMQGFQALLPRLSDGVFLAWLTQRLLGKPLTGISRRPCHEAAKRGNITRVIEALRGTPQMSRR